MFKSSPFLFLYIKPSIRGNYVYNVSTMVIALSSGKQNAREQEHLETRMRSYRLYSQCTDLNVLYHQSLDICLCAMPYVDF